MLMQQCTSYRRCYIDALPLGRNEGLGHERAKYTHTHTVLPWIQPQSSCAGTRVYFNQRWPTILAMVRENTYDHAFTQSNKEKFSNLTSVSGHMATSIHRAWVGFSPLTKHRFQFFFSSSPHQHYQILIYTRINSQKLVGPERKTVDIV